MRSRRLVWIAVGIVLCGLAIPWFLWGDGTVVAGLPLWLWWHVGWMVLASAVFWLFATRAWGIGIETDSTSAPTGGETDRRSVRSGGDQP
ncbi:DUF3311 domain-containing protein [Natrarchaeobius oligotrophus]|uniref:DUF3311 domain-containing protein n=1 Tax=Natrarchaeobius chitinivorans TaxID=1679083 RepID=A0A3N6MGZ7_NATCH|nr:DUF3311 domain-containing protein [Natrarchaeobius chitinivorans]RQH03374.1 DUF3311 domain-containing protein [Natrarchaeobius chitinivorans]